MFDCLRPFFLFILLLGLSSTRQVKPILATYYPAYLQANPDRGRLPSTVQVPHIVEAGVQVYILEHVWAPPGLLRPFACGVDGQRTRGKSKACVLAHDKAHDYENLVDVGMLTCASNVTPQPT